MPRDRPLQGKYLVDGKNISPLLPAGPVEVAGVRGGGVRPRGASQPGRGGVNRRVVAQSVVGLARGGGCPRAAARIHEGAALGVDLLPLFDGVEEDAAHAAAGGDLPQLLLLLLQLVVDLVPVGLRLLRLVLLHGLGPAPPPRLVRVEEGRRGEVVPLYRRGLLLLHLLPVRIVRHLDGLLVVHVWGPRSGRLGLKYFYLKHKYFSTQKFTLDGFDQGTHPGSAAGARADHGDLPVLVAGHVEVHRRVRGLPVVRLDGAAEAGHAAALAQVAGGEVVREAGGLAPVVPQHAHPRAAGAGAVPPVPAVVKLAHRARHPVPPLVPTNIKIYQYLDMIVMLSRYVFVFYM